MTPHTIRTKEELLDVLSKIRTVGYAFDDEESTLGLQCLAVPVRGQAGDCVAALSISAPGVRMAQIDRSELLEVLLRSSRDLSRQLGWRGADLEVISTGM